MLKLIFSDTIQVIIGGNKFTPGRTVLSLHGMDLSNGCYAQIWGGGSPTNTHFKTGDTKLDKYNGIT